MIVDAARTRFAKLGYEKTTIRGIAQDAKVDPALVHHFFETKEGVFAASIQDVFVHGISISTLVEPGIEGVGGRLAQAYLRMWESSDTRESLLAIIRAAVSHEEAADLLRQFVSAELLEQLRSVLDAPDAEQRVAMVGAQLLGIVMLRHLIRVESMVEMEPEEIARYLAASVDYYLTMDMNAGPA